MSSNSVISTILDSIAASNNIFGKNYRFVKDDNELAEFGITDKNIASFYARRSGMTTVIKSGQTHAPIMLRHRYRFVFQVPLNVDKDMAEASLFGEMTSHEGLVVNTYETDAHTIYRQEAGGDATPNCHLFMFDCSLEEEVFAGKCDCLTIETCLS